MCGCCTTGTTAVGDVCGFVRLARRLQEPYVCSFRTTAGAVCDCCTNGTRAAGAACDCCTIGTWTTRAVREPCCRLQRVLSLLLPSRVYIIMHTAPNSKHRRHGARKRGLEYLNREGEKKAKKKHYTVHRKHSFANNLSSLPSSMTLRRCAMDSWLRCCTMPDCPSRCQRIKQELYVIVIRQTTT